MTRVAEFDFREAGLQNLPVTLLQDMLDGLDNSQVGVLNVRNYGATGDGITDDTAAVQAALTAAAAGDTVFVPVGTYVVSGINISSSSVVLMGAGVGSILKLKPASNTSLLTNTAGVTDITIRDLAINGNNANQSSAPSRGANGILLLDAQRITIDGVYVYDTYTNGIRLQKIARGAVRNCIVRNAGKASVSASGIDANPNSGGEESTDLAIVNNHVDTVTGTGNGIFCGSVSGSTACQRILIAGNHVNAAADEGIEVLRVQQFTISNNVVSASAAIGVYCRESSQGAISGNTISGGAVGIQLDTQAGTAVSDVAITGNTVSDVVADSTNGAGIKLTSASLTITGVTISGNRVVGCKRAGIDLTGAAVAKTSITGNTVSGCDGSGISVVQCTGGISIVGNTSYNNGQNAAVTNAAGILVFGTNRGIIAGNFCYDDQGGSATQNYGVYVTDTSAHWTVIGNRASGATTSDIAVDATGGNIRRVANADGSNTDASTLYQLVLDAFLQAKGTPTVGNDAISVGFTAPNGIIAAKNTSGAPAANLQLKTTDGVGTTTTVLTLSFDLSATFGGKVTVGGELDVDGAFNHDGTTVGFYGVAPVTRASVAALTDNSAGTANDTVQALTNPADTPASADALRDDLVANLIPELRNNYADLAAKVNALRTALVNLGLVQ